MNMGRFMNKNELQKIAKLMVSPQKGILAADESTPTCTKRFEAHQLKSTDSTRNEYRSTLFTSLELENYISGINIIYYYY